MSESERGQVTGNAAEVYEEFFVPALFQEWTDRVAEAARVSPGERVLDVACGTGALTRTVAASRPHGHGGRPRHQRRHAGGGATQGAGHRVALRPG
jgi:ubiquinone/menaquinone biosynthesis C-methylase UbiE